MLKQTKVVALQGLAGKIAEQSKDKNTKVGAVIVDQDGSDISWGYNGFPRDINDDEPERHERPEKYLFAVHAETNAIINAARKGSSTKGGIMVVTMFPCANCAGNIVNAGIKEVICPPPTPHPTWDAHIRASTAILREGGVDLHIREFK